MSKDDTSGINPWGSAAYSIDSSTNHNAYFEDFEKRRSEQKVEEKQQLADVKAGEDEEVLSQSEEDDNKSVASEELMFAFDDEEELSGRVSPSEVDALKQKEQTNTTRR